MGKKRRQSKKEREAKRRRDAERLSVGSMGSEGELSSESVSLDVVISERVTEVADEATVSDRVADSEKKTVILKKRDEEKGTGDFDSEIDSVLVDEPDSDKVASDKVAPEKVDSDKVASDKNSVELLSGTSFGKGSLYAETLGSIWPDEPDRHRKVSTWAWVSGTLLCLATLGLLLSGVVNQGDSEKGRTIVSRPGEHKVEDSAHVFTGRSVTVEVVGGMVTQTSAKDLVRKVESVIDRDASEWRTDAFKKTGSVSREMKVSLLDGKTTEGMFEVYVDYDTSKVILLSEKGYIALPDGVGKQIFNDLSQAGKYKD